MIPRVLKLQWDVQNKRLTSIRPTTVSLSFFQPPVYLCYCTIAHIFSASVNSALRKPIGGLLIH